MGRTQPNTMAPWQAWQAVKHELGRLTTAALSCWQPREQRSRFGILMYHRVTNRVRGLPAPTWNVSPARFKSQLRGLLARKFTPWSLSAILEMRRLGQPLPPRAFVVTFDDAYDCVYHNAFPVLRELKIPATIFIATAYLDSPQPFPADDWSLKGSSAVPENAWRILTREHCHAMHASGLIEFGAHTHTHGDFRRRLDAFRDDLQLNLRFLRELFPQPHYPFAFPYGTRAQGYASPGMIDVARTSGVTCALSSEPELALASGDPFQWGRFNVEPNDSAASLAGKLLGWHDRLRSGLRRLEQVFSRAAANSPTVSSPSP